MITTIRYADGTAVIAPSQEIQRTMNKIFTACKNYGMKLNVKRTKVMVMTKSKNKETLKIKVGDEYLEQVSQYRYLGSIIDELGSSLSEVKTRIVAAKDGCLLEMQRVHEKRHPKATETKIT